MKYDTIIIGGGLSGLTAGATLSKFGKKVLLIERHYKPGGCATTFKRGDFIVEVGLHEMSGVVEGDTLPQIFDMLDVTKEIELPKVPEFYAVVSEREKFVLPHGFDSATKALVDKYPEDEKGIKRFFKVIPGIRKDATSLPRSPVMSKLIYPIMPFLYPDLVEASRHTIGSWLDRHVKNEEAKLDIVAHLAYWGDDPYTLSLFYFGLPFSGFVAKGGRFVKGGSQKLSDSLASYIEKHGGTVLLGTTAEKIEVENGEVTGVTFKDRYNSKAKSVTVAADNVVANCAIPTVPRLLNEPYSSQLAERIKLKTNSCSLLCMYLGFRTDVAKYGVEHYSNYFRGVGVKSLKDVGPNNKADWSKRSFIFVDYGKVDSELAPAQKSEGVVCAVDYIEDWNKLSKEDYKAKKEEVAQNLIQRLDEKYPGIRECIEYYEVSTSQTIERFTSNPTGSVYGYAQTPDQIADKRFRNNFLLPNLYFASAWAFPGGGFEGSITGGFLVALQMNKDKIWSNKTFIGIKDEKIVKLKSKEKIDEKTLSLTFEKPTNFEHQEGQYAILKLLHHEEMVLDLPYRWLPIKSTDLTFKISVENNPFSKSCESMRVGDEAMIFGPIG